jgi:transposase
MINRQKTTQNKNRDLHDYFENPVSSRQRQYEAVRAVVFEKQSPKKVAKKYGYKPATLHALVRDAKSGKLRLFPEIRKGPKQKRTPDDVQSRIVVLRKQGLSTADIASVLAEEENATISERTVERIVKLFGFGKLKRRTNRELGKTSKNKMIPDRSAHLDFSELEPFNIDCPVAGVFFFIPYVLESGILDIVKECRLPESSDIGSVQACLSMLFFKLIGGRRLSHMSNYDREPGLGVFAGLNVLPKTTYMGTYSCRCWENQLADLQNRIVSAFRK